MPVLSKPLKTGGDAAPKQKSSSAKDSEDDNVVDPHDLSVEDQHDFLVWTMLDSGYSLERIKASMTAHLAQQGKSRWECAYLETKIDEAAARYRPTKATGDKYRVTHNVKNPNLLELMVSMVLKRGGTVEEFKAMCTNCSPEEIDAAIAAYRKRADEKKMKEENEAPPASKQKPSSTKDADYGKVWEYANCLADIKHDGHVFLITDGSKPTAKEIKRAKRAGTKIFSLRNGVSDEAVARYAKDVEERMTKGNPAFAGALREEREKKKQTAGVEPSKLSPAAKLLYDAFERASMMHRAKFKLEEAAKKDSDKSEAGQKTSSTKDEEKNTVAAEQEFNAPGTRQELKKIVVTSSEVDSLLSKNLSSLAAGDCPDMAKAGEKVDDVNKINQVDSLKGEFHISFESEDATEIVETRDGSAKGEEPNPAPTFSKESKKPIGEAEAELRAAINEGMRRGFLLPKEPKKVPISKNAYSLVVTKRIPSFGDCPDETKTSNKPSKEEEPNPAPTFPHESKKAVVPSVEDEEEWHDEDTHGSFNPADPKCKCAIS